MRHKVAELEGALLDAAVAKAENDPRISMWGDAPWIDDGTVAGHGMSGRGYCPSTDWRDGGPIIQRERIAVEWRDREEWWNNERISGARWLATIPGGVPTELGQTPMIAAMRAYCASKFGDEVELP
jgi:hypothetical protein